MNIKENKTVVQKIYKSVTVAKKCDICGKDIPPLAKDKPFNSSNYLYITTHHHDWGNDSVDSFEYYDACSPECAIKFATKYLTADFNRINTDCIEIEHKNGWGLPDIEDED